MSDVGNFTHMATALTRSPWDTPRGTASVAGKSNGRTEQIRSLLRASGPLRAGQIATHLDIERPALVYALLKNDIVRGRVTSDNGLYSWNHDYERSEMRELARAVKLLRRHGYTVVKKDRHASLR